MQVILSLTNLRDTNEISLFLLIHQIDTYYKTFLILISNKLNCTYLVSACVRKEGYCFDLRRVGAGNVNNHGCKGCSALPGRSP